jgi:hypothetical protein
LSGVVPRYLWRAIADNGVPLKGLAPRSGQAVSPDWLKFKNPRAPAVKREMEEN